jgi:hypothetical protein
MYFSYTTAQNYVRTLTQGVTLADGRVVIGGYNRKAAETEGVSGVLGGCVEFSRRLVQEVCFGMTLKASPTLIRKLIQQVGAGGTAGRWLSLLRRAEETAWAESGTERISQAKRTIADIGKPVTEAGRNLEARRGIAHGGGAEAETVRKAGYVKRVQDTAGSTADMGIVRDVVLRLVEAAAALYEMKAGAGFNRGITDSVKNSTVMGGMALFFRTLFGFVESGDSAGTFIERMRVIEDTGSVGDDTGHTADYLRGLFVEAGNIAETKHRAEYYRKQQDPVYSEAVPLRHLFIFIRLVTLSLIRDYLIPRFLRSREEVVIKSPIVREIILESKV